MNKNEIKQSPPLRTDEVCPICGKYIPEGTDICPDCRILLEKIKTK